MASYVGILYRDEGILNFDFLYPLEVAFSPGVDQAKKKDPYEHENFHECENALAAFNPFSKNRGNRKDKGDFDFEDYKNQRHDIETNVEINPCAPGCRFAAFVGREFSQLWIRRP